MNRDLFSSPSLLRRLKREDEDEDLIMKVKELEDSNKISGSSVRSESSWSVHEPEQEQEPEPEPEPEPDEDQQPEGQEEEEEEFPWQRKDVTAAVASMSQPVEEVVELPWIWEPDAPPLYRHIFNKSWEHALQLLLEGTTTTSSMSCGADDQHESDLLKQALWSSKPSEMTALHVACLRNAPPSVVEALLCITDRHAPQKQDKTGRTPLHHAAVHASAEAISLLIQRHPRGIDIRDFNHQTPLCLARAAKRSDAILNTLGSNRKLADSICERDWYTVHELLRRKEHDVEIHTTDKHGRTALHLACKHNAFIDLIGILLDRNGSAALVKDNYGNTPLHIICSVAAASQDDKDNYNETDANNPYSSSLLFPLANSDRAIYSHRKIKGFRKTRSTPNALLITKLLLSKYHLAASVRNDSGHTPLFMSIQKPVPIDMIQLLIQADPVQVGAPCPCNGFTPLHLACGKCLDDTSETLVRTMVQARPLAASIQDNDGCTPLHIALYYNRCAAIVRDLLQADPKQIGTTDRWNKTPLYYFYKQAHAILSSFSSSNSESNNENNSPSSTAITTTADTAAADNINLARGNTVDYADPGAPAVASAPPSSDRTDTTTRTTHTNTAGTLGAAVEDKHDFVSKLCWLLKAETAPHLIRPSWNKNRNKNDEGTQGEEFNVLHAALQSSTLPHLVLIYLLQRYYSSDIKTMMCPYNGAYTLHIAASYANPPPTSRYVFCNKCHRMDWIEGTAATTTGSGSNTGVMDDYSLGGGGHGNGSNEQQEQPHHAAAAAAANAYANASATGGSFRSAMFYSHGMFPVFLCRDCVRDEREFHRLVHRERMENPFAIARAIIRQQLAFHHLAASIPDGNGRLAINIALEAGKRWNDGVQDLFAGAPAALRCRDIKTFLHPFMLSACTVRHQSDVEYTNRMGLSLQTKQHRVAMRRRKRSRFNHPFTSSASVEEDDDGDESNNSISSDGAFTASVSSSSSNGVGSTDVVGDRGDEFLFRRSRSSLSSAAANAAVGGEGTDNDDVFADVLEEQQEHLWEQQQEQQIQQQFMRQRERQQQHRNWQSCVMGWISRATGGQREQEQSPMLDPSVAADRYDRISTVFNLLLEEPSVVERGVNQSRGHWKF